MSLVNRSSHYSGTSTALVGVGHGGSGSKTLPYVVGELAHKIFSYFYQRLPSLPGVRASVVESCTKTSDVNKRCETPVEFAISPETANGLFKHNYEAFQEKVTKEEDRGTLIEEMLRTEGSIIGRLRSGEVLTFGRDRRPIAITSETLKYKTQRHRQDAWDAFQRLAKSTGGIMALENQVYASLKDVIQDLLCRHILHSVGPNEQVEVAVVADVDEGGQIERAVFRGLRELKESFKIAILEYVDDPHGPTRVKTDFTSKEPSLEPKKRRQGKAIFDALHTAKHKLSWSENARKFVLLVGNTPPNAKTLDGRYGETEILEEYRANDIAIYPVLTGDLSEEP